jgi:hypothetical protein
MVQSVTKSGTRDKEIDRELTINNRIYPQLYQEATTPLGNWQGAKDTAFW